VPLPEKLLRVPLPTVTSPAAKLVVDSFAVNDTEIDEELLVAPSLTVELAIVIVGPVVSITKVGIANEVEALPVASVTVTVLPLYVPSPRALKVIVLLPFTASAFDGLENPSVILVVIVPASSLLNTKLGVTLAAGVEIAVTVARVGAVVSIVTLPVPVVTAVPALLVPFFVSPKAIL
jgi:hypothetical protein